MQKWAHQVKSKNYLYLMIEQWKKYVFPIYMIYNGKGRKDALPMKF